MYANRTSKIRYSAVQTGLEAFMLSALFHSVRLTLFTSEKPSDDLRGSQLLTSKRGRINAKRCTDGTDMFWVTNT